MNQSSGAGVINSANTRCSIQRLSEGRTTAPLKNCNPAGLTPIRPAEIGGDEIAQFFYAKAQ
jgi:hypothetical protein